MKKTEKSESIANDFLFVKESLESLRNEEIENKEEILNETFKRFDEIIKFFKGTKRLFLILFTTSIVSLTLFIASLIFNQQIANLNTEIEDIKTDTIANQILGVRKIMLPDSSYTTTYDYRTRNNKVVSYNDLLKEIDSLNLKDKLNESKISTLESQISSLESKTLSLNDKLNLAQEYYDIRFWETSKIKRKDTVHYINIESKKVDSALILLQVYRKKLFYNKESKGWEIKP
jgi:cell division protein FtsL